MNVFFPYRRVRLRECFIDELHDDILYDVFCSAAEGYDDVETARTGAAHASERIALVCRRWRNIATESPRLWSRIEIDSRTSPTQTWRWLSLSRQAALTVRWTWWITGESTDMDNHIQLLNLHASRIETLRFRANGDWAAGPALSDFLAVLSASPALRTLDIQGPNAGVWGFLEVEATRSSFPALRELMLMRLHVHGAWPTHNLTVLVLHDLSRAQPSWPELTTILQSSPDLKELSLTAFIIVNEGTEGSSVESPVNEPIALPRLEKLALWNMPAEVTSLILESIQASALQALIVGSTLHLPNLIPTITSSATTLRHLRLGCLSSEDPAILSALRIPLPKLERLGIFGGERFSPLYIHDAVFEAMVEYKQLTTLDFSRIFIGVDLLVGMIHWRRELDGCQAIKRVIFSDGCQTSKPWGDLKSSLLDLGAQIDFADEKEDGEGRDTNEDWFLEERSSTLSKVQVMLICLLLMSSIGLWERHED